MVSPCQVIKLRRFLFSNRDYLRLKGFVLYAYVLFSEIFLRVYAIFWEIWQKITRIHCKVTSNFNVYFILPVA